MPLYKLSKESIAPLESVTFAGRGLKERNDLQRLLRANIAAVAPEVLVIAEEFGDWEDSKRRIDLLGVDKLANLVVIELKRDEEGGHMDLQAIRYASMISKMTYGKACEVFQNYLDKNGVKQRAEPQLLEFLGWHEAKQEEFAPRVRIILVAANFSKELTTAVLWLNESGLDLTCVRLVPYAMGEATILDVQQIVPLPEAEAYTIQIREKEQEIQQAAGREALRLAFWKELLGNAQVRKSRFAEISPSDDHWLSATAGIPGVRYSYLIWQNTAGFELYIDRGQDKQTENKRLFDYLYQRRAEIEKSYGGELSWNRLDGKRASRILEDTIPGGIRSARSDWPVIRGEMIARIFRFENALTPHLQKALAASENGEIEISTAK